MDLQKQEQVLFSLPLARLEPIFKSWIKDVVSVEFLKLHNFNQTSQDTDRFIDLDGFRNHHPDKPSRATVYGWVSAGKVPVHKSGKKLRFLKSEIDAWLTEGRKKTSAEIAEEASAYFSNKNNKRQSYGK